MAVFTWIESWYNPHRLHSSLDYLPGVNYPELSASTILSGAAGR
jgi:transposase InsO family protein